MKFKTHSLLRTIAFAFSAALFATQPMLNAQQNKDAGIIDLDSIIVTGTRTGTRTVSDSIHPIDLVPASDLTQSLSAELTDALVQIIPSFNVQRLAMSDGLIYVRPATLRGLSPDHTLVMVNGKRFHRSPMIGSRGAQGADLAQIPANAIERIEVLRDGASAQYGSDAIAGAINILLHTKAGCEGFAQMSKFFEGDGEEQQYGFRAGFEIDKKGFFGISVFSSDAERTSRSRQRPDAIAFQQANPDLNVPNPVQRWGQPDREVIQITANTFYQVSDEHEIYAFGTFGKGEGMSDFNWRNPTSNVFNTAPIFPGWNLRDLYPTGFSPQFGQKDMDYQLYAGVRDQSDAFTWDLSAGRGRGEIEYKMTNSINASMGPESPTEFDPGTLIQEESTFNFDASYAWNVDFSEKPIHFSFGAERRTETFEIQPGDEPSYLIGPGAPYGLASGSNGFPGYSKEQAGDWDQGSYAFYGDLEWNPLAKWSMEFATRYEDYDSFGSNFDYKLANRFQVLANLAVRASISTGFRAPTPGQIYSTRTSQGLNSQTLQVQTSGRLSPLNPVSLQFGSKALEPETSDNLSGGLVWNIMQNAILAVDFYQISVDNRFGGSPNYAVTQEVKDRLLAAGVSGADSFTSINFYTNDYDTETSGVDITYSQVFNLNQGSLNLSMAYNQNKTKVTGGSLNSNPSTKRIFEENLPKDAGNISLKYTLNKLQMDGRIRYFGSWTDYSGNADEIFQKFGSMLLFDLSASYEFSFGIKVRVGAENLFNSYPDEATLQANRGLIYPRSAPYSTDGGRWFCRVDCKF